MSTSFSYTCLTLKVKTSKKSHCQAVFFFPSQYLGIYCLGKMASDGELLAAHKTKLKLLEAVNLELPQLHYTQTVT